MRKGPRNFLFALVILIFLVIAPVLILFALGYRYDFETNKLRKTAIIALEFQPEDVQIFLDDEFVDQRKETIVISGVTKDKHAVRLVKDKYHVWEQETETKPGFVTWLSKIILFQQDLTKTPLTTETQTVFSAIPQTNGSHFALISQEDSQARATIEKRELTTQEVVATFSEATLRTNFPMVASFNYDAAFWGNEGNWLLVPVTLTDETTTHIALNFEDLEAFSLEAIVAKNTLLFPAPERNTLIMYTESGKRRSVNLATRTVSEESNTLFTVSRAFQDFTLDHLEDGTCALQEFHEILRETRKLHEMPCAAYEVMVSPRNNVVIRDTGSKKSYFFNTEKRTLETLGNAVEKVSFAPESKDTDVVLFSDGAELRAYLSEKNENILLTRTSQLRNILANAEGSHAFILNNGSLAAIEITNTRKPVTVSWDLPASLSILMPGSDANKIIVAEGFQEKRDHKQLTELTLYE